MSKPKKIHLVIATEYEGDEPDYNGEIEADSYPVAVFFKRKHAIKYCKANQQSAAMADIEGPMDLEIITMEVGRDYVNNPPTDEIED